MTEDKTATTPKSFDFKELTFAQVREDVERRRPQLKEILEAKADTLERVRRLESFSKEREKELSAIKTKGIEIERLAHLDALTELPNHQAFVKEMQAELMRASRYSQEMCICLFSVDKVDEIYDKYGPLTRDAISKVISNVIRTSTREVDICAVYSPVQFAIIFAQTQQAQAALVAERIRKKIGAQVISYNWESFSITASFGIASHPRHGGSYEDLLAKALESLEHAIERGGDRVFCF